MSSAIREMEATLRERTGKGGARTLRREGMVPAVLYGKNQEPVNLALSLRDMQKWLMHPGYMTRVLELKAGKKTYRALPRDLQLHPVTELPEHADFLAVDKDTRVNVEVAVHFLNKERAPGIKRGGVLNIVRREVELVANPDDIPDHIEVDLAGCQIGDSIHISAITLPEGVVPAITDRDFTVATIVGRGGKSEAEETAAEGEEEGEGEAEAKKEE